ncbi:MAG: helix-turn-helix domain-containing protein [Caldilineaceae bacterium]|nr:helix-turn-helix domain-containing protein [Caldilineaceae bacterium]
MKSAPVLHDQSADAFLFAWTLLQTYGEHPGPAERDHGPRTFTERLAAILAAVGERDGSLVGVNLQAFADVLNADRETVASLLRAFQRQGLILLAPGRIDVLDAPGLEELAYL